MNALGRYIQWPKKERLRAELEVASGAYAKIPNREKGR